MSYKEQYRQENEAVAERTLLVSERIAQIASDHAAETPAPFSDYFEKESKFLTLVFEIVKMEEEGVLDNLHAEKGEAYNRALYEDLLSDAAYEKSYLNPAYAVNMLGEEYGGLLCFLASELRQTIGCAYEGKKYHVTICAELFSECFGLFAGEELPEKKELEQTLYWFFHDYSEIFSEETVRGMVDPEEDFFVGLIKHADLSKEDYLYRSGAYIGENEKKLHAYLNTLSEEEIKSMANTYTEGYRIGFEVTGKDLSKKKTVCMEYPAGFERVMREAVSNFEAMGLRPTVYREADSSFRGLGNAKRGYYSPSLYRQYAYDHKNDKAYYLDKAFVERRLETLKCAYEKYADLAAVHGGPAVVETFGEADFTPMNKKEAASYTEKQNSLNVF